MKTVLTVFITLSEAQTLHCKHCLLNSHHCDWKSLEIWFGMESGY